MDQKINPNGFRLPVTRNWTSRWYAVGRNFSRTLGEDLKVRSFLEKKLKNAGNPYVFSPYALIWSGDFYYVVGYSEKHNGIGGFRVDRIAKSPTILEDDIIPKPADFNIADYAKSVFQMYGCEECEVTLRCDNRIMKYIIERFGEDVTTAAYDMTSFRAFVNVELSPTFYGWVFGFGGKVQILSPDKAKNQYAEMLKSAMETQA